MERQFHSAMISIYQRALVECNYKATLFLRMVSEYGGLGAAKRLLHAPSIQYGFEKLWELGRLDLTMESLILKEPWGQIFTEEELTIAKERLKALDYNS